MTQSKTPPRAGRGRPPGSLNKTTKAMKEFARAVLDRPAYQKSLQKRLDSGKAPHMEVLYHHYAHGKPKETVRHEGETIPPFVLVVQGDHDDEPDDT